MNVLTQYNAEYYIEKLALLPHPEGGYYKSTYASNIKTDVNGNTRSLFTSIYFLLRTGEVSHFHRLNSDELWYYHGGSSLTVHVIDEEGNYQEVKLGMNID